MWRQIKAESDDFLMVVYEDGRSCRIEGCSRRLPRAEGKSDAVKQRHLDLLHFLQSKYRDLLEGRETVKRLEADCKERVAKLKDRVSTLQHETG